MQANKSVFFTIFWIMGFSAAFGQATRSPFSSLGLGDRFDNSLAHNQGMAGVGISNPQYWYLNNLNPALLVYNGFTVLEGGFIGERRTIKGNGVESEKNGGGNLNYLAMGLPIKPGKWSASVGLMPYSNVNYRISYTQNITGSTNSVSVIETGTGGVNQAYISNGFRLYKSLTAGVKFMYLFSSIQQEFRNTLTSSSQTIPIIPGVLETNYFKDINFSAGLAYNIDSLGRKNNRLNFGLTYDFQSKINTEFTLQARRYLANGNLADSVTLLVENGKTELPQSFAFGISYGRPGYWILGTDFSYQDYSTFRDFRGLPRNGISVWRYAVGLEVTPGPTSLGNYLKRMTYRAGASYEELPYSINGSTIKDFGINFGFSMPVGRFSSLDLGARIGKRGDLQTTQIEENYFKIYFGVTFNDQWFIKRKFD